MCKPAGKGIKASVYYICRFALCIKRGKLSFWKGDHTASKGEAFLFLNPINGRPLFGTWFVYGFRLVLCG